MDVEAYVKRVLCLVFVAVLGMWSSSGPATADTAGDRIWVQYLAKSDPRSPVRIAAWQALLSGAPEAAIAQFVESGYDYAVKLFRRTESAQHGLREASSGGLHG